MSMSYVDNPVLGVDVIARYLYRILILLKLMFCCDSSLSIIFTDYVRTGLAVLVFDSSGTGTVLVGILDDDVIESTESLTVVLSNPQPFPGVVLGTSVFTITITDDDPREPYLYLMHT